jgi:hypothetical protein
VSLFLESVGNVVVTCAADDLENISEIAKSNNVGCHQIGFTVAGHICSRDLGRETSMTWSLDELRDAFSGALESQLESEVVTA